MRLTIVRQDYRPEGLVERVIERALEALLERNVAVSLYTRSWPQTRLQLVEPLVLDPFHLGATWRDWSFARAACRDVRRSQPNLVEAHERMLCCDLYRATGPLSIAPGPRLAIVDPRRLQSVDALIGTGQTSEEARKAGPGAGEPGTATAAASGPLPLKTDAAR
jgi:hypothetical protein